MAAKSGRTDPPLDRVLFEEGYRFDFFQAVRLLERLYPNRFPVGYSAAPANEATRFRAHLSLTFPPSAIHQVVPSKEQTEPDQMVVAFMGLFGPMGLLPRHYTELLIERVRQKDFALRDFLDLFNHRFVSLFYRAWEKYHFEAAYERERLRGDDHYDPFSRLLFHLIGMGTAGLQGRLKSGDEVLLYYAGLAAQQPHSASALEAVLGDYFGVPAKVAQFVGTWLHLDSENRTRLGASEPNNQIGMTAILGSKCWDQQAGFRVVIGPMSFREFCEFLPSDPGFQPLVELTRFFTGLALDFEIQLVLKATEVPFCRLNRPGPAALRLGWSSWLKTKEFTRDASEAVLGKHLTRLQSPHQNGHARAQGGRP
jgi:type VI secretion system protein ImpH